MNHSLDRPHEAVRIFIGSSAKNIVEEKVFVYSLQKLSSLPLEINIIDGDTGSVRMHTGEVKQLPVTVSDRMKGATAFSLARFAIPQWCDYQGKAIYCDSDQLSIQDIAELWNYDLANANIAAVHVRDARSGKHYVSSFLKALIESKEDYYLTSVMLMNCAKLKDWDIEAIVQRFNQEQFSYPQMMFLNKEFTGLVSTQVTYLPNEWNHLDVLYENSKILHFTDLTSQPWLFNHNPAGAFWEKLYLEAIEQGFVSQNDILQAYEKQGISRRIKDLPSMRGQLGQYFNSFWRTWAGFVFLAKKTAKSRLIAAKFYLKQATSH